ncbi:muscarinic acetylcholine receptor M4 [Chanos chanos]|uniref:Muscarinic acetylcholine receptor n=1 Tax=Chanos chanos TaxID=29144 RepID=A0A6J2VFS3_CHACN|nr:muscarinic acetylcholine receptor M4-like [Chanos chanos]
MKGIGFDNDTNVIERLIFNASTFNSSNTASKSNSSWLNPATDESCGVAGRRRCPHSAMENAAIAFITGSLSLLTVVGNILVLLSIKVNRRLRTVNNYFLFSLACADLLIGLFSMNLYIIYIVQGYWSLGVFLCDMWLVVDYVVSNASVMHLLIICFDRYLCITRPLTYPAKRTAGWARLVIAAAWVLSFFLWAPAILLWQSGTSGKRLVPEGQCYIQLLASPAVTMATTIPAFYLPVIVMTVLYCRISLASQSRLTRLKPCASSPSLNSFESTGQLKMSNRINRLSFKTNPVRNDSPQREQNISVSTKRGSSITNQGDESPASSRRTDEPCTFENPTVINAKEPQNRFSENLSVTQRQLIRKRRRASRERKVTRTVLAVLLAFIITWTPHNVMVLVGTFCHSCVPGTVWTVGYWLCYMNSTINPACYALCNAIFRKTFKSLLLCQFRNLTTK